MEQSTESGKLNRYAGNVITGTFSFLIFIVGVIVLETDKNLQTDFGFYKSYYYHWWILLGVVIITLLISIVTIFYKRKITILPFMWSLITIIIILADPIFFYKSVGFSNSGQFFTYLFSFSKYPGTLSYIPGLFTVFTVLVILNFIISGIYQFRKSS